MSNTNTTVLPETHQMVIDLRRYEANYKAAVAAHGHLSKQSNRWSDEANAQWRAIRAAGFTVAD